MKRSTFAFAAILAPAALGVMLAAGSLTPAASADAGTQLAFAGPGYGMGPGGGMGPYWMDGDADQQPGMRPGGFGMRRDGVWPGAFHADANHDRTLTVDEVTSFLNAMNVVSGRGDFKVGEVKEADDTIKAQIVDASGDVVRTLVFPTKVDTLRGPANFGPGMRGDRRMSRFGGPQSGGPGQFGPGQGRGPGGSDFFQGVEAGLQADGVISTDEIKGLLEKRLAMWNNPNVKVGNVVEKDDNTISAEIVTKDGSLVQNLEFDRKTGRPMWNR